MVTNEFAICDPPHKALESEATDLKIHTQNQIPKEMRKSTTNTMLNQQITTRIPKFLTSQVYKKSPQK